MVGDVDFEGCCTCVVAGDTWKLSASSSQFCYEPETALKKKKALKTKALINRRASYYGHSILKLILHKYLHNLYFY
jgi:hypothetical protein